MLFFPLIAVEIVSAAPPDAKLLSLVPPGTQLVAGACNHAQSGAPESFLLTGRYNLIDRRDFLSLAGVDDSMRMGQMIFASGGGDPSRWGRAQYFDKRAFRPGAHLQSRGPERSDGHRIQRYSSIGAATVYV